MSTQGRQKRAKGTAAQEGAYKHTAHTHQEHRAHPSHSMQPKHSSHSGHPKRSFWSFFRPDKRLRNAYFIELAKLFLIITFAAMWFSYASLEYGRVNAILAQNQAAESQATDTEAFWATAMQGPDDPAGAAHRFFLRTGISFLAMLLAMGACAAYLEYEVWRAIRVRKASWRQFGKTLLAHLVIGAPFVVAAGIAFFFLAFKASLQPNSFLVLVGALVAACSLLFALVLPFIEEDRSLLGTLAKASKEVPKTLALLALLGFLVFLTLVLLGFLPVASQELIAVLVLLALPLWIALVKRALHDWAGGDR